MAKPRVLNDFVCGHQMVEHAEQGDPMRIRRSFLPLYSTFYVIQIFSFYFCGRERKYFTEKEWFHLVE